jgi:hypothetical protein
VMKVKKRFLAFAYLCPKSANVDVEPLGMLRTRRPDTWFNFLYAVTCIIMPLYKTYLLIDVREMQDTLHFEGKGLQMRSTIKSTNRNIGRYNRY